MSLMGKATEKGLEDVAKVVLFPHFHLEDNPSRKVCELFRTGSSKRRRLVFVWSQQFSASIQSQHLFELSEALKAVT